MSKFNFYNRSEILSFFDLSEDQQAQALDSRDQEKAEETSYVLFNYPNRTEVLGLDMFMSFGIGGGKKNPIWDGYYCNCFFAAYFIKFNQSNDGVLIAERYS